MAFAPVATKLHPPKLKAGLVPRPRLLRRLQRCSGYKLTLLSAAAGCGKSTLLSQWAQEAGLRVAWLGLDEYDNEPGRFLSYLIYALQTIRPDIGGLALELLAGPQRPELIALLAGFINELDAIDEPLALILDDYHLIDDGAIHEAMAFLLQHLPDQIHLVIAARSDPPLPLARLRAQGELLELRSDDLRFEPEEGALFLNTVMKLDLQPDDISRLFELTEGWIIGLQLAALIMQGRQDKPQLIEQVSGDHRYIFDYLGAEVFERQPEPVQNFLLGTAILERLNADLSAAVLGQPETQQMLFRLERANLFLIPLDDRHYWFRYHYLFADFLERRLRQRLGDAEIATLHQRAAGWYETAGLIEEALHHLWQAGDFERMAAVLEEYVSRIWTHGQMPTLRKWLEKLPEGLIYASPRLALSYVSTLIDSQYLDKAERYLRQAEIALNIAEQQGTDLYHEAVALRCAIAYFREDAATALSLVDYLEAHLPAQNMYLRTFFALNLGSIYAWRGQVEKASGFLHEAIKSGRVAGNVYLTFLSSGQLGIFQTNWGQLFQAYETFQQALGLFKQPLPITGWIHIYLAGLFYEWNDREAALGHLSTSIELYRLRENRSTLTEAYLLLARLKQSQGDPEAAAPAIREAVALAQAYPAPALLEEVLAVQAELALVGGQLERVKQWAERQPSAPEDIQQRTYEAGYTLAGWLISQGRVAAALALLEPMLAAAQAERNVGRLIQLKVRQALAWQQQGWQPAALAGLSEALSLAEPGGYVRSFIEAGPALERLLKELFESGGPEAVELDGRLKVYGQKLLQAFSAAGQAVPEIQRLTLREIEVLKLIAAGLTNQQIADELVIARGTVKKHLDNLYEKLEVHNRTQALARARALGLMNE